MANTYTQIYIHVVFAVQGRQNLIKKENKEELHKYIAGIIRNKKQKLIATNPALRGSCTHFHWRESEHSVIRFGSGYQK